MRFLQTCATAVLIATLAAVALAQPSLRCDVATRTGRRIRQEDVALAVQLSGGNSTCPPLHLVAVFDGHDGARVSAFASEALPAALEALLNDTCVNGAWNSTLLTTSLKAALADVDARVLKQALPGGTTAVAALVVPDGALVVAHVGDSRAYVCSHHAAGGGDAAHLLTRDHTPEAPRESARLLAAGGTVSRASPRGRWRLNGELAVSRALGDATYRTAGLIAEAETSQSVLTPGDALLLLSDGALEAASAEHLCALALGDWVHAAGLVSDGDAKTKSTGSAIPLPGASHGDVCRPERGVADVGTQPGSVAAALADAAVGHDNAAVVVCLWGSDNDSSPAVVEGSSGSYVLLQPIGGANWDVREPPRTGGELVRTDALQVGPSDSVAWCEWFLSHRDLLALPDGHADADDACAAIRHMLLSLPASGVPEAAGFTLDGALGHGGYGQVHRARRLGDPTRRYVIKRVPASASPAKMYAALREIHFGQKLVASGQSLFVESVRVEPTADLWLAFLDGGANLDALMFGSSQPSQPPRGTTTAAAVLTPSRWWLTHRSSQNSTALRDILKGLLLALDDIHSAGVAHRDVKGANIVVAHDLQGSIVRLVDFGSAVDELTLKGDFYPAGSPSADEETAAFAPPEARFGSASWPGRRSVAALQAFDVWSAGVVGLQLLCTGAEDAFELPSDVTQRTLRSAAAAGLHADAVGKLLAIKGLSQLCISPWIDSRSSNASLARAEQCSEARLLDVLRAKDPTGAGISPVALRLLRHLLRWDPAARVTARRALQHAYFAGENATQGGMIRCADGREVEWSNECG